MWWCGPIGSSRVRGWRDGRGARFRGPFTDYRIETDAGTLEMRRAGEPEWAPGDDIEVTVGRWWEIGA